MYLAQLIDQYRKKSTVHDGAFVTGYKLIVFRVEIGEPGTRNAGRPVWRFHKDEYYAHGYGAEVSRQMCVGKKLKGVPTMQSASHGKLVSMSEATRLTGVPSPGALDYLTEMLAEAGPDNTVIRNYVKPKAVKEPKLAPEPPAPPSRAALARGKLAKAEAKVAEWAARAAHAEEMRKKWAKKARAHEWRANTLAALGV